TVTYDHRLRRIGHPVRSAIHKPQISRLVVGWVTTSEYLLLYVFCLFFFCRDILRMGTASLAPECEARAPKASLSSKWHAWRKSHLPRWTSERVSLRDFFFQN
ncbi:hypothetical protein NA56DRAFT_740832, partial [Hyaloscypha hepaticicola]